MDIINNLYIFLFAEQFFLHLTQSFQHPHILSSTPYLHRKTQWHTKENDKIDGKMSTSYKTLIQKNNETTTNCS